MISFLQNILQRHYKWLFSILLVVIIVSFVFTIGAAPGIGRAKVEEREFYGFNLNSEEVIKELSQAANLTFVLNTGEEPYSPQELEQAALSRALFLSLADDLQIPSPTEQQLIQFIQKLPYFQDPYGNFDNKQYQAFLRSTQFNKQFSQGFVRKCLLDNFRIEQVQIALRGPAYVLPNEVESHLKKLETDWTLQVARFSFDSFTPNMSVNEEDIQAFFDENQEKYTIPSQHKVSYLLFDKNKYINQVEDPSESVLKSYYERHFSDFEDQFSISDREAGFEQFKAQITLAYKESKAQRNAATAANQFLYTLYDQEIERGSLFFQQLLKENNLVERSVRAFSPSKLPEHPNFSQDIWAQAFMLTQKNYYSNVASHEKNAVILLLDDIVPSRVPTFEQVRPKVAKDFSAQLKRNLFKEETQRLQKALASSLEGNEPFPKAAKKLGLQIQLMENISLENQPEQYTLLTQLQDVQVGSLSQPIEQNSDSLFVLVQKKTVPQVSQNSENWDDSYRQLGLISQIARAQGAMAELIHLGIKES